jgi:acyl carrier protein
LDREQLKKDLKKMIVTECQKDVDPESITDEQQLIGGGGALDLDSLDALQISMAVNQRYKKRIDGNNETRNALASINALADFILA